MRVFDRICVDSFPRTSPIKPVIGSNGVRVTQPCKEVKPAERKNTHYSILGFQGSRSKIQLRIGHPGANVDLSSSISVERSLFRATLCCSFNNLSDSGWPPKSLRNRERHPNRGLESWVRGLVVVVPRSS